MYRKYNYDYGIDKKEKKYNKMLWKKFIFYCK